jgi:phage gp36-like protein
MPWLLLSSEHLDGALAAAEVTALRTLQVAAGQADPVSEAIDRAAAEVQGYVGTRYQVGQPGTVPDQLLSSAIAIARWRLLCRLPAKVFATEARRKEYEDAIAQLRDVAAGKFALSVPEDPAEEQPRPTAGGAYGNQVDAAGNPIPFNF